MFATMIHATGEPRALYRTKQAALAAAKRLHTRTGSPIEVVWCNDYGSPKLWLAMVDTDGVTYDDYWHDAG